MPAKMIPLYTNPTPSAFDKFASIATSVVGGYLDRQDKKKSLDREDALRAANNKREDEKMDKEMFGRLLPVAAQWNMLEPTTASDPNGFKVGNQYFKLREQQAKTGIDSKDYEAAKNNARQRVESDLAENYEFSELPAHIQATYRTLMENQYLRYAGMPEVPVDPFYVKDKTTGRYLPVTNLEDFKMYLDMKDNFELAKAGDYALQKSQEQGQDQGQRARALLAIMAANPQPQAQPQWSLGESKIPYNLGASVRGTLGQTVEEAARLPFRALGGLATAGNMGAGFIGGMVGAKPNYIPQELVDHFLQGRTVDEAKQLFSSPWPESGQGVRRAANANMRGPNPVPSLFKY